MPRLFALPLFLMCFVGLSLRAQEGAKPHPSGRPSPAKLKELSRLIENQGRLTEKDLQNLFPQDAALLFALTEGDFAKILLQRISQKVGVPVSEEQFIEVWGEAEGKKLYAKADELFGKIYNQVRAPSSTEEKLKKIEHLGRLLITIEEELQSDNTDFLSPTEMGLYHKLAEAFRVPLSRADYLAFFGERDGQSLYVEARQAVSKKFYAPLWKQLRPLRKTP